jgi:tRNA nucleotidyltransferase (CCA-adding enzyme)
MVKLDSSVFNPFLTNELKQLIEIFKKYNYEIRIAGGAVRDLLMNIVPKDIDLATNATPDEMKIMFERENIRTLNRNGEKHGTITVRLSDEENYEITTLRIDVVTDGRHAEVRFTNDWKLDANRRDLTVNSLFLDFDGVVHDYFNGVEDIKKKEVHFVGEPATRIREDYLRILRYFRFFARISENEEMKDLEALEAIRENAEGMKGIHGERIWTEFKQILVGRYADVLIKKIIELGVYKYIGLPDRPNFDEFSKVYNRVKGLKSYQVSPVTMVSTLFKSYDDVSIFFFFL